MKRTCRILAIAAVLIMIVSSICFADGTEGGLVLQDTYPKDGASGAAIENFDIKLYFNNEMSEKVLGKQNDGCFTLTDADGHKLPIIVLYSPKESGVVMVLFDSNAENLDSDGKQITIKGDSEYTLNISGSLKDDKGNTLGADKTVKFKTINQSRNSLVSMLLMLVLYAGIIFFSMRNAKHKQETEKKEVKFNPYKEAKRTGKTVAEVMEKERKRQARKASEENESEPDGSEEDEYIEDGHYRVKAIRTVASGGSSYITGRKAEAEARKEREERYARSASKKKVKGKGKRK